MTLLITLTSADLYTGPFDLYSDVDGFTTPFETGVSKIGLLLGYTTSAPDNTLTVRITSTGLCTNSIDVNVNEIPTTTTTSTTSTTTTSTTTTSTTTSTTTTSTTTTSTTTIPPPLGIQYYVSNAGNNSNDGLTPATSWQTLAGVNSKMGTFNPGDEILFKRGDSFSGFLNINISGSIGLPIKFGAYGTGAKPLFTGTGGNLNSAIYILPFNSYITIDNIGITDPTFPADPTRAIKARIDDGINIDQSTNCIVSNCDISLVGTGVYTAQGGNHLITGNTIYNLRMIVNDGTGDYGANPITLNSSNNTVTHNTLYGGWALSVDFGYDGGAIEFYDEGSGCSNNFIAYNTMYDNNGIAETDGVCNNNIFVYNKMINNRDVFYFHGSHTGWKFYNNVVIETSNSRLAPTSTISGESGTTTSMDIKNNVFQIGIGGNVLAINTGRISGTHTNNVYKISGGTSLGFTLNLTEVNTGTAIFNNTTDPDPVNWDYSPLLTGILLNTGTTVGYTPDFAGTPVVNPPDIGIIEHQLTPGQSFQGGTVWYVDGTGQHGLIVSPTNAWNHTAFSYGGITLNCGASSTAIGDGQANTNILLACDPSCYAATYCNNYSNSGYTDWYLPTIGDLEAMYNNGLDIAGNVPISGSYAFSSSESIVTPPLVDMYSWNTSTNTIFNQSSKNSYGAVIPVRSF